jgi:hypothetical protein
LLFPLDLFSATEMELIEELKLWWIPVLFWTLVKIMLSFLVPQ